MAGEQWYYVQAGQRLGPVSVETQRSLVSAGAVAGTDLVWRDGMPDWVTAGTIPALMTVAYPSSSAVQRPPVSQPQSSQSQYTAGYGESNDRGAAAPGAYGHVAQPVNYYAPSHAGRNASYAGFWLRFVAAIIDGFIVGIATWILIFILATVFAGGALAVLQPGSRPNSADAVALFLMGYLIVFGSSILIHWLYFAGMESSAGQGTLGKRAMGICVTDEQGNRVSFKRASGRFFGKLLSGFMLIGYIMAAFTRRKQALHDLLAGCLVLTRRQL